MAVKVCCIMKCKSCSTRTEDVGVTYHKFPRDVSLCDTWIKATRHSLTRTDTPAYVCSRHFCKSDFQIYQDSKYVLKSDAVPSIFPWITEELDSDNLIIESIMEDTACPNNKESEGENLEAIKKFIEDQEKEFLKQDEAKTEDEGTVEVEKKELDESKDFDERLAVASSMMDMILSESEEQISNKSKTSGKQSLNSSDKGNSSMLLSVGSKVEAKDFSELWYPAKIVEVDYEEMEVLVRYDNPSKKHDEWISVSSPRLRPLTASAATSPTPTQTEPSGPSVSTPATTVEENKPAEDKQKLVFVAGERCLARWRDNRRFMATVTKDLGDGQYEVTFDDGFQWKCATSRLHKLKDPTKTDVLSIDTNSSSSTTSAQSPVLYGAGPSTIQPPPLTSTAFHTHLFDPTRDYLGSKSERREMKRKLNIKEIFNIGQKKTKKQLTPKEKVLTPKTPVEKKAKPRIIRRKMTPAQPKKEIPDAVASIIGTREDTKPSLPEKDVKEEAKAEIKDEDFSEDLKQEIEEDKTAPKMEVQDEDMDKLKDETKTELFNEASDVSEGGDSKPDSDPVQEEEVKLEKFEQQDEVKHEEVIDRMKEVINKLEDGISKAVNSPKPQPKEEIKAEVTEETSASPEAVGKKDRKLSKIKKGKKLRLLQEKKVKKQVEKVKSELEVMKRQFEEMRQQMLAQTEELAKGQKEMPESYLLPGEWCCKWVNGQPVGTVSELEGEVRGVNSKPGLPRRSVQVEDKRLPPGWTKHMVRRSLGNSAGKWDVVLVSPDNRRFHTRTDMRNYMSLAGGALQEYEHALMDFGIHLKLSRRMGWVSFTPGGVDDTPVVPLPAGTLCSTSPLVKRRKLSLKRDREVKKEKKEKKKKNKLVIKMPKYLVKGSSVEKVGEGSESTVVDTFEPPEATYDAPPLEDGYVWVGSLKVQIIENLLRCPAEGCFKNFRNNTLLQMHIKHYHRDLRKMLGRTPKVLDLAYARTMPTGIEPPKAREPDLKTIKVKIHKPPKRVEEPKLDVIKEEKPELPVELPSTPVKMEAETPPKLHDSPKLRNALVTKRRPRVLLPVRRPDPEPDMFEQPESEQEVVSEAVVDYPTDTVDFETAISTHTVTKPTEFRKKEKKGRVATLPPRVVSEDDEWLGMTSDVETRSSFPRSGTPDSKTMEQKVPVSSESNEDQKNSNKFMYTETGERIKIVHMKREEIINCHCGFREEDGLMVQCELCLCWQHALCHNIHKESEVPEKYTCSICLNPRRGRRSQRFLHDQDRLYEGLLPGARGCDSLRRSHELSGNLLRVQDALHALRVKYYVATKKDHPKLYLWAKDWENGELTLTQEKLNSDYSDLNIMISGIGKENLPMKQEDLKDPQLDIQTPPSEEHDRYNQRDTQLGTSSLLTGLLSSPGASLDLPISTSELERLAKTVQEEVQRAAAPQPEAAIENSACRERLLRHIQRCQAVIDARLDSIEAQVAELESQDPSFEDDETADYFPRTKQTIQMLMRDLDTMEELGVIT